LPTDVLRQRPDDLDQRGTDEVVVVDGCRLAVEHGHDQSERFLFGEHDGRQPRAAAQPVSAVRTPGRLDGDACLTEDPDVPTRGALRDTQSIGEVAGRDAGAGLEDLECPQRSCGRAQVGGHPREITRVGDEPEADRPESVLP
jgi:hypothetical protein